MGLCMTTKSTVEVRAWPQTGTVEERWSSPQMQAALADLRNIGFAVFSGYWPADRCAAMIDTVDGLLNARAESVRRGSDLRLFALETASEAAREFKHDPLLERLGDGLTGQEQKVLFVLANRLAQVNGQARRSGGEWHRDRVKTQYKALVYLSDVGPENGPFSIFERSDRRDAYEGEVTETGFDFAGQRWRDDDFAAFLERAGDRLHILTGAPGTLVVFNSSLIHSGQPIRAGERYAITNYYYAHDEIDLNKVAKKFVPSLAPIGMPVYAGGSPVMAIASAHAD